MNRGALLFIVCFVLSLSQLSFQARLMSKQGEEEQPLSMRYHDGYLLSMPISVNLIWYGNFTPSQRSIISDFFSSLTEAGARPAISDWWFNIQKLYQLNSAKASPSKPTPIVKSERLDQGYSLGKSLRTGHIVRLASRGTEKDTINIVLTSADVTVDGFCMSRCGTHGYSRLGRGHGKAPYIWVGNSEKQCPGHCAWPFQQPMNGPYNPPLVPPNGDVGMDGMVINIASLLASTVTNPYGNGYFQGPAEAPLEAASACSGVYGKGSYPGFAGQVLVDQANGGASYNARGINGRHYLLPAIFDPKKSQCLTIG